MVFLQFLHQSGIVRFPSLVQSDMDKGHRGHRVDNNRVCLGGLHHQQYPGAAFLVGNHRRGINKIPVGIQKGEALFNAGGVQLVIDEPAPGLPIAGTAEQNHRRHTAQKPLPLAAYTAEGRPGHHAAGEGHQQHQQPCIGRLTVPAHQRNGADGIQVLGLIVKHGQLPHRYHRVNNEGDGQGIDQQPPQLFPGNRAKVPQQHRPHQQHHHNGEGGKINGKGVLPVDRGGKKGLYIGADVAPGHFRAEEGAVHPLCQPLIGPVGKAVRQVAAALHHLAIQRPAP